jgi:aryl-alcohol dehydrogenase-like predicted oxidoreductase
VDAVAALAGEKGCTPAQLSLAWLLTREGVASVTLGARTAGQLREQVDASRARDQGPGGCRYRLAATS